MAFPDTDFALPVAGRVIRVRVTGDALQTMWGANTGPQTAHGLIEAHNEMIAHIVGDKLIADEVGEDGVVLVRGLDIEG